MGRLKFERSRVEGRESAQIIRFSGDLDVLRKEALTDVFRSFVEKNLTIVDISGVSSINAVAIEAFVVLGRCLSDAAKQSSVVIVGANPAAAHLFKLAALDTVFAMYDSLEEAEYACAGDDEVA